LAKGLPYDSLPQESAIYTFHQFPLESYYPLDQSLQQVANECPALGGLEVQVKYIITEEQNRRTAKN